MLGSFIAKRKAVSLANAKAKEAAYQTDEALIQHFINGSQTAFETLVQRYKQRIFEFIYFQIKQHQQDAEDLTQDVFIQLYEKATHFRQDAKFSSFLYAIAKHIVFNYFRAKSRTTDKHLDNAEALNLDDQPSQNPTINTELGNAQKSQKITQAMNLLSVDERQILFLADKENFSYAQIANILAINLGTVRSRIHSARNHLIKKLTEIHHDL